MNVPPLLPRRLFLQSLAASVSAAGLAACYSASTTPTPPGERLTVRPSPPTQTISPGMHDLGLAAERDARLYVPASYDPAKPMPLMVLLHGAGGSAARSMNAWIARADAHRLIVLAPDSRGRTWDMVRGDFGPDVRFIDQALSWTFARCNVAPKQLALAGFSDGASYALSLGTANGDLFSRILAFSPGFLKESSSHGDPRYWISHGTRDPVLPYANVTQHIIPALRRTGSKVAFTDFDGVHELPEPIAQQALAWLEESWRKS